MSLLPTPLVQTAASKSAAATFPVPLPSIKGNRAPESRAAIKRCLLIITLSNNLLVTQATPSGAGRLVWGFEVGLLFQTAFFHFHHGEAVLCQSMQQMLEMEGHLSQLQTTPLGGREVGVLHYSRISLVKAPLFIQRQCAQPGCMPSSHLHPILVPSCHFI